MSPATLRAEDDSHGEDAVVADDEGDGALADPTRSGGRERGELSGCGA